MSEGFGKNKPTNYIKKSELKEGDKITILSGGGWVEKDFSTEQDGSKLKNVYVLEASVNGGDKKELTINATSGDSLFSGWGEEGDGWVGKIAKVTLPKMMSFGKMQPVLCLVPADEKKEEPWPEEEA